MNSRRKSRSANPREDAQKIAGGPPDPPWDRLAAISDADALALGGQQCVWLPLVDALEATEKVLQKGNPRPARRAPAAARRHRCGGRAAAVKKVAAPPRARMRGHGSLVEGAILYPLEEQARRERAAVRLMLKCTSRAHAASARRTTAQVVRQKHRIATTTRRAAPCVDAAVRGHRARTLRAPGELDHLCRLRRGRRGPEGLQGQRGL